MRQDALDSIAYSEKAIRKMRKTVDKMSIKIIDKKDVLTSSNLTGWDTNPRQNGNKNNGQIGLS